VIQAAQAHGVKASICGETASDPEALPIWLGLGLREFSVTAAAIPATKSLIRQLDISGIADQLASRRLSLATPSDVRTFSRSLSERRI
jgi:phosphoenolpyruvate-protein kinase (PTS system EI component)